MADLVNSGVATLKKGKEEIELESRFYAGGAPPNVADE